MPVTWQHLYSSAHWQRLRQHQLRDDPLCSFCLGRGEVMPATVADHVEPHGGDVNKFLDSSSVSVPIAVPAARKRFDEAHEAVDLRCFVWSEWQDLNLRPPRPERCVPSAKP
jgi:hypothetical protein